MSPCEKAFRSRELWALGRHTAARRASEMRFEAADSRRGEKLHFYPPRPPTGMALPSGAAVTSQLAEEQCRGIAHREPQAGGQVPGTGGGAQRSEGRPRAQQLRVAGPRVAYLVGALATALPWCLLVVSLSAVTTPIPTGKPVAAPAAHSLILNGSGGPPSMAQHSYLPPTSRSPANYSGVTPYGSVPAAAIAPGQVGPRPQAVDWKHPHPRPHGWQVL